MHHALFWAQLMANLGLSPWLVSPVVCYAPCTMGGWLGLTFLTGRREEGWGYGDGGYGGYYGNHAPCSHVEISELITFSRCRAGLVSVAWAAAAAFRHN